MGAHTALVYTQHTHSPRESMRDAGRWAEGEEVRVGCARGIAVDTYVWRHGRRLPWLGRTRLPLARPAPVQDPGQLPGCTSEDAWPSCPGSRPVQLSQVDCFPREPSVAGLAREAGSRPDGWGRPQAGEPPVLSSRLLGLAQPSQPSLRVPRQCRLSHQTPQRRAASLPSDSPGQDRFLHHTFKGRALSPAGPGAGTEALGPWPLLPPLTHALARLLPGDHLDGG